MIFRVSRFAGIKDGLSAGRVIPSDEDTMRVRIPPFQESAEPIKTHPGQILTLCPGCESFSARFHPSFYFIIMQLTEVRKSGTLLAARRDLSAGESPLCSGSDEENKSFPSMFLPLAHIVAHTRLFVKPFFKFLSDLRQTYVRHACGGYTPISD